MSGNFFGGQFFGGGFFGSIAPTPSPPAPSYLGTGSPGGAPGPHSPFFSEFTGLKQRYPWGTAATGNAQDEEDVLFILTMLADKLE